MQSTTVLSVRRSGEVAIGADGQVTMGQTVVKADACKIRKLMDGKVIVGFAGSAADAFGLLERFEAKLEEFQGNVARAATELAKDWRTDKILRRLESLMIIIDKNISLLLSGQGDVIEPTDGVIGVGSGGQYAVAAAKALLQHTDLTAQEIVKEALAITSSICIYTNDEISVEVIR